MWRLSSTNGKQWVQVDADGVWAASGDLQAVLIDRRPAPIGPNTGQWYTPSGEHDEVALLLHARAAIGQPSRMIGRPPAEPAPEPGRPGAVY